MLGPIWTYWVSHCLGLSLDFCIIENLFGECGNKLNLRALSLDGVVRKTKEPLTIIVSLSITKWFLISFCCTSAFPTTSWRSFNPCSPSGLFENIPAVSFNFLELVRILKVYFEGKLNKQMACSGEGSSKAKNQPPLTFGDKGLGVATVFRWHRGIWSRTWLWVFQE